MNGEELLCPRSAPLTAAWKVAMDERSAEVYAQFDQDQHLGKKQSPSTPMLCGGEMWEKSVGEGEAVQHPNRGCPPRTPLWSLRQGQWSTRRIL